jgi:thiamine biosynthesis lipoprotein
MKFLFRLGFILLLVTTASSCNKAPVEYKHTILKFDTLIDVTIYGVDEKLAERAFADLDRDFEHYHHAWTPYEPGPLTRSNELIATGSRFSSDTSTLDLINRTRPLAEKTGNLFNPAIGKLIKLWQFHKHDDPDIRPPDAAKIAELVKARPQLSDLEQDGIRLHSRNPYVELNFGAFAKGYAADLSMQYLKSIGIHNAVIAVSGDVRVIGHHGDRGWRIGIKHPRQDAVLASIELRDNEGISTSGDYERFFMYQGKRYHHILDPRTGYPAQGTQAVTVVNESSALADVAATALFVAGPDHWQEVAKNLGVKMVMLTDSDGVIHISPAMQQRVQFIHPDETTIRVSPPL